MKYAQETLYIENKDFRLKFVEGNDKELVMKLLKKKDVKNLIKDEDLK